MCLIDWGGNCAHGVSKLPGLIKYQTWTQSQYKLYYNALTFTQGSGILFMIDIP